jgi:hypothetical protein
MSPLVGLVGCTRRGRAACDQNFAGMRPGQRSIEGDAGAGDLGPDRVRVSERRSNRDCAAAKPRDRGDNCRL